jgi:hypothetical protein
MSTTAVRSLASIAREINESHARCEASYRTALEHAARIGELLHEAKAQLSHGDWLPWLAEHTTVSARHCQRYMRVASTPNATGPTYLGTIDDALGAISTPAPARGLRAALRGVDRAEAEAALAELGPVKREDPFPASGVERETWRQIRDALGRITRAMDEASASGLSKWSRREALHEAARHARSAAAQLSELADTLAA